MFTLQHSRMVAWVECGVLFLAVAYLFAHTMPRAWNKLNTDFPNYYLSARLAHEGFDTSREYEWTWLQREKDHRGLDVRIIGLLPITPFSTLVMWPLTGLAPLTAKRVWLLTNFALLVPLGWMLRSMTELSYRRIALVFALSFPLHRNFLFGQFYLFLLLLIVAACWSYLREWYVLAGALAAVAAACKIFPVLFLVFFLQRRAWRAVASGAVTLLAISAVSVAVFGWNLHRTYLREVLPWTLRGEALPPYATASASISSVLHYLLLNESQWNPRPWHYSPLGYALLLPMLQMLALAPAILFIRNRDSSRDRILIEWSALLVAALTISTVPASYNFVLLAFPACVLAARLLGRKQYGWLAVLTIVYLGIGFPMPSPNRYMGPAILLYVPRLSLMLALLVGIYALLWRDRPSPSEARDWTSYAWLAALAVVTVLGVRSALHVERAARREYAYRVPFQAQSFLEAGPTRARDGIRYIAFTQTGYQLRSVAPNAAPRLPSANDELSFTNGNQGTWTEDARQPFSRIVDLHDASRVAVGDAREPMLSMDGQELAFVRDDHGRGQLMARKRFQSETPIEVALTPKSLNVYEASFLSEKEYAFSAAENGRPPAIYLTDGTHTDARLGLGESRYPALSRDGHWMAYSRFKHGNWNLWLRDQTTGATRRIADVPCNQIQPAWEDDSKTLLYTTDCGRSLWFTAVARRRVIGN